MENEDQEQAQERAQEQQAPLEYQTQPQQEQQEQEPEQECIVLTTKGKRQVGRKTQLAVIEASKHVADSIRTSLGPRAMMKMIVDAETMTMTNDGHAILNQFEVSHPAAKSMISCSKVVDNEVGDGTTSVVILTGELLQVAKPFMERNIHPSKVCQGFKLALNDMIKILDELALPLDLTNKEEVIMAIRCCIATKFAHLWSEEFSKLAYKATLIAMRQREKIKLHSEMKRFIKVEKILGDDFYQSEVLDGIVLNQDVCHSKMRRKIKNPKIIQIDCHLQFKKSESHADIEMTKETDIVNALKQEEMEVRKMCHSIIKLKPDILITEKGVSSLAEELLAKEKITCLRRVKRADNQRLARVTGATIQFRPEELTENDIGTKCGMFEVKKIGDQYYSFFTDCPKASACSVILRGGTKDLLDEMERNFQDCLGVAKNIMLEGKLLAGGGATEMAVSARLMERAVKIEGIQQLVYKAAAGSLEVIPRTLAQNCGLNVIKIITELRSKHNNKDNFRLGIDGGTGQIENMRDNCVWDTIMVKKQIYSTAIETACMLLKIDDVISGFKKPEEKFVKPKVTEFFYDEQESEDEKEDRENK